MSTAELFSGLQNHDPGEVVWFKEVSVRPVPAGTAGASGKVAE
jgi:hypothetical protein